MDIEKNEPSARVAMEIDEIIWKKLAVVTCNFGWSDSSATAFIRMGQYDSVLPISEKLLSSDGPSSEFELISIIIIERDDASIPPLSSC